MGGTYHSKDRNRGISSIFCPATFREVLRDPEQARLVQKVIKYKATRRPLKVRTLLYQFYGELESNYCNEYLFKNSLLNTKLLEAHGLADTVVLNEFRIANSIADFVLLNGEIRTFEIKTDLDNFDKLEKQILDYQQFSNRVSVVVSSKAASRMERSLSGSTVGLIAFNEKSSLQTIKESVVDNSKLSHEVLFKALRKSEYISALRGLSVDIPEIPNTMIFRECLQLSKRIDILEFQTAVRDALKTRTLKCPDLLNSDKTPKYLKHICYSLNPSETEYRRLFEFLDTVH
jgi:hypothetical protein